MLASSSTLFLTPPNLIIAGTTRNHSQK